MKMAVPVAMDKLVGPCEMFEDQSLSGILENIQPRLMFWTHPPRLSRYRSRATLLQSIRRTSIEVLRKRRLASVHRKLAGTKMPQAKSQKLEFVEPIGKRVLVRKDQAKRETKGGIALPDQAEIPTITGRVVAISAQIQRDEDFPLKQYDKILFHPKNAIPVDLEHDNQLFVIPIEDVVAVFRREPTKGSKEE